ncbi:hypothetical protein D9M68_762540 [compost metagenome]
MAGPRHLETAQRDGARVFAVQPLKALAVLLCLQFVGLGGPQGGLRRVDAGGAGGNLPAGRLELGARSLDGDLVLLGVYLEEHCTGLDHLIVARQHPGHPAGHFGGHRHDQGLHPGLLRVGGEAVRQQVPEQAQDDQPEHPLHALVHRVGGRLWRRRGWRSRRGGLGGVTHLGCPCWVPGFCLAQGLH